MQLQIACRVRTKAVAELLDEFPCVGADAGGLQLVLRVVILQQRIQGQTHRRMSATGDQKRSKGTKKGSKATKQELNSDHVR